MDLAIKGPEALQIFKGGRERVGDGSRRYLNKISQLYTIYIFSLQLIHANDKVRNVPVKFDYNRKSRNKNNIPMIIY